VATLFRVAKLRQKKQNDYFCEIVLLLSAEFLLKIWLIGSQVTKAKGRLITEIIFLGRRPTKFSTPILCVNITFITSQKFSGFRVRNFCQ